MCSKAWLHLGKLLKGQATRAKLEEVGIPDTPEYIPFADDDQNELTFPDLDEEVMPEVGNEYVHALVMLPHGNQMMHNTVKACKWDLDGNPIGCRSDNPILDMYLYDIKFLDGEVMLLTTNAIAQAMYAWCIVDGNEYLLVESFVDVQKNPTVISLDEQRSVHNGQECMHHTTLGWHVCCQWKDGSISWEKLSDVKESHPLQIAEYDVSMGVDHEPGFNWWVPCMLKKRDAIIALGKKWSTKYLKQMHKFGIECPKTVEDAMELDKQNGITMWAVTMIVQMAFNPLENGTQLPNGYRFVQCHMIFDGNMEDFCWKAQLVAGGHMIDVLATVTYVSIVSRETVRMAPTLAVLNTLKVMAADTMNVYITVPIKERYGHYLVPSFKFGKDRGHEAIVVRAFHGLKSTGAAFRSHLADCMTQLRYECNKADPDLWMKVCTWETANGPKN